MLDIYKYTYDEVKMISKETRELMKVHLIVYDKAIGKILCNEKIETSFINENKMQKNCNLDKYLDKYFKENKDDSNIKELITLHDNFHELISSILIKNQKKIKISTKEFQDLSSTHIEFLNLLNKISHSLEFVKYQFDKLTSAWSREIFIDLLNKEYLKATRRKETFSLVFFDIDYFKKVNDTYSHEAGDLILKELILLIKEELRSYDTIARWGGEEFLILLSQNNLNEALKIIQRIKDRIQNNIFTYENNNIQITCSFGICEFNNKINVTSMINNADKLMYKAKKNGRNKIEI